MAKFLGRNNRGGRAKIDKDYYFLDDNPIDDLSEQDLFGHIYYARTLFEILEKSIGSEPYAVGLFGEWGVGKTTIINDLQRIVKENEKDSVHKYTFLVFDAWEYSEQNFRREFLLDLANEFGYRGQEKEKLSTTRAVESKQRWQHDLEWWGTLFVQLVLWGAILILGGVISERFGGESVWGQVLATVVAFATVLRENIKDLFKLQTIIKETSPAIHPDEFRDEFKWLIKHKVGPKAEKDRAVFVLDNLDRVKEEIAIQILAAVKTFLQEEKCIYILPCDDRGLKQHIISSRGGESSDPIADQKRATEYLRKFFRTTLTIRALLKDDIDNFTQQIVDRMKIFNAHDLKTIEDSDIFLEDVVNTNRTQVEFILRIALSKNPRRIIQLANKITSNYLLAKQKGVENPRLTTNIMTNLGFLAKITVIEEEWENFYEMIVDYPDILRQLDSYLVSQNPNDLPQEFAKLIGDQNTPISKEWNSGLRLFLRQTSLINSQDVGDFVLFNQPKAKREIADYNNLRNALLAFDEEYLEQAEGFPLNTFKEGLRLLADELGFFVANNNMQYVVNLINSALLLIDTFPTKSDHILVSTANAVTEALAVSTVGEYIESIELSGLLNILSISTLPERRDKVIEHIQGILDFENKKDKSFSILNLFVEHSDIIRGQAQSIRERLSKDCTKSETLEDFKEFAFSCIVKDEDLASLFLPEEFYIHFCEKLLPNSPGANQALAFIRPFIKVMGMKAQSVYLDAINRRLVPFEDELTGNKKFALRLIDSFLIDQADTAQSQELVQMLSGNFDAFTHPTHMATVAETYLKILPHLQVETQQLFGSRLVKSIPHFNETRLIELMSVIQRSYPNVWGLDQIIPQIRIRVADVIEKGGVNIINIEYTLEGFYSLIRQTEKSDQLIQLIVDLWGKSETDNVLLEDAKSILGQGEFKALILQLVQVTEQMPIEKREIQLEIIGNYSEI